MKLREKVPTFAGNQSVCLEILILILNVNNVKYPRLKIKICQHNRLVVFVLTSPWLRYLLYQDHQVCCHCHRVTVTVFLCYCVTDYHWAGQTDMLSVRDAGTHWATLGLLAPLRRDQLDQPAPPGTVRHRGCPARPGLGLRDGAMFWISGTRQSHTLLLLPFTTNRNIYYTSLQDI